MIDEKISTLYEKLRMRHYQSVFGSIKEKSGSLSATEAFAADAIYLLDKPTIKQFSDFLGISQPNATYKINSLITKGYVKKVPSLTDGREFVLVMDEKYTRYQHGYDFIEKAVENIKGEFSEDELEMAERLIDEIRKAL